MKADFVKIGNTYINLNRVQVVRDYPEANETLVVFSDPQSSEVFGAEQRRKLLKVLKEVTYEGAETSAVTP